MYVSFVFVTPLTQRREWALGGMMPWRPYAWRALAMTVRATSFANLRTGAEWATSSSQRACPCPSFPPVFRGGLCHVRSARACACAIGDDESAYCTLQANDVVTCAEQEGLNIISSERGAHRSCQLCGIRQVIRYLDESPPYCVCQDCHRGSITSSETRAHYIATWDSGSSTESPTTPFERKEQG